jgi:MIP family channel proteins
VERRGPSAYIAELLGTMVLVFAIGMVLSLNQTNSLGLGYTDFAVIGLVHVFVLAMLIHTLGGTSGAHFNPAVTVIMAVLRKIRAVEAAGYIVVQLVGGVLGALLVKLLLDNEGDAVHYGAVGYGSKFLEGSAGLGFAAELIGTFLLVWAIMGAAVNPRANADWAPWIIGGTLGMAVMIIGPLTGAGFNPARAFGPAIVGDAFGAGGKWIIVYVLGPIVGAVLAGIGYTSLVLKPRGRAPGDRPIDSLD